MLIVENWQIRLSSYKYSIKLIVEVIEKYKITKNNKIMIYLKEIIMKFDKYIKNKKKINYKKLEASFK